MKTRVINFIKRFAAVALFAPAVAMAAGASVHLDKAPVSTEPAALQHGAKLFVNYCLNCHSARSRATTSSRTSACPSR